VITMDNTIEQKLICLLKDTLFKEFNLCDVDMHNSQGANMGCAIETSIKYTILAMKEFYGDNNE